MFNLKKAICVLALGAIALSGAAFAQAPKLVSGLQSVNLNATLDESISVVSNQPVVNFQLQAGQIAQGDNPMSFKTDWVLASSRSHVYLDAYFADPSAALVGETGGATAKIPSSEVFGLVTAGVGTPSANTAFVGTSAAGQGGAGVNLQIFDQPIALDNLTASRNDSVQLSIDLTGHGNLPSENYSGVVTIVATAL